MRTEELIERLAARATPIRPLPPPSARLLIWAGLAIPMVVVVALSMGLRDDLSQRLAEPLFQLRLVSSLVTALLAALAGLTLGIPGRTWAWVLAPLLPLILWLASLGSQCLLEIRGEAGVELLAAPHLDCLPDILVMIALPTIAILMMVLKGAGFHRRLELALGGLAAAALSNTALSLAHPVDAGLLILLLQMVVVGVLAMFLGRRD